jgi:hypothetical protein
VRRVARSAVALPSGVQPDVSTCRIFRLFRLLRALFFSLFFPLIAIVPALAAFISPAQGLALKLAAHLHCKSIVFFPKFFSGASSHAKSARKVCALSAADLTRR